MGVQILYTREQKAENPQRTVFSQSPTNAGCRRSGMRREKGEGYFAKMIESQEIYFCDILFC